MNGSLTAGFTYLNFWFAKPLTDILVGDRYYFGMYRHSYNADAPCILDLRNIDDGSHMSNSSMAEIDCNGILLDSIRAYKDIFDLVDDRMKIVGVDDI